MTHAEKGYGFYRERKIPEAVREFRLGREAGEDPDGAALERWLSFMTAGEFESAWRESDRVLECRRKTGATCGHLPEHQRWLWDGAPLEGKRVRVRCFHGLGDTIQFVRFLPRLRDICREVQFVPQVELQELIPAVPGGEVDLEIELMEVPHALRVTLGSIPAEVPYLNVRVGKARRLRKLRLGLAWASGVWRPQRSIPLESFGFLNGMFRKGIVDLELVGLQRGPATLRFPAGSPTFHEADWGNVSVAATARIIGGLDMVITTDTMVAHLAGALGVQVWTLLHWDADWRWLDGRDDSPWYPTMRLFRQRTPGDWDGVLQRVQQALMDEEEEISRSWTEVGYGQERACAREENYK